MTTITISNVLHVVAGSAMAEFVLRSGARR